MTKLIVYIYFFAIDKYNWDMYNVIVVKLCSYLVYCEHKLISSIFMIAIKI